MNKFLIGFLIAGWLCCIALLVSGYLFKKWSYHPDLAVFAPISWDDHLEVFKGAISCTLTDSDLEERRKWLKTQIFSKVVKKETTDNGILYYFQDEPEMLEMIFELVRKEKACCSFFKFDVSVLPFQKGIALQVSGSKEAIDFVQTFESEVF